MYYIECKLYLHFVVDFCKYGKSQHYNKSVLKFCLFPYLHMIEIRMHMTLNLALFT